MTGMLEDRTLGPLQPLLGTPGSRPCRRIFDGESVQDGIVGDAREPLDHAQVLAGSSKRILAVEVRRLDHQRIALPAAARDADPLAKALRRLRAPVERDDPRVVDHLGENHGLARRLHDLIVGVVA